jgi:3-oxoacyl-[acyl-carrier-protein] synthase II
MTALPPCRAVITGIGCVSPSGLGGSDLVTTLLRTNATAIAPIRNFSTATLPHHLGAEVVATNLVQDEEGRRWSRVSQMAVAACRLAVAESRLSGPEVLHPSGLVIGTEFGDLQSTEAFHAGFLQRGPRGLRALLFPNTVMNSIAGLVSLALGIKGPILTLNQAGVAGELAVARAMALLTVQRAPAVIACGVDELFSVLYEVLGRLHIPSPCDGGEEACRPFDRRHNGPVLGEGATALVLETLEHAQARGATMLAGVYDARWGAFQTRAHRYPTPTQLHHRLLDQTFAATAIAPTNVGVAYLSGAGDPRHDTAELDILAGAFGSEGPLLTSITHLNGDYGGLGALRVAAATITATQGLLPTLSYLDQPLRSDVRFARQSGSTSPTFVLVHGLARGGVQTALLIGPPPA